MYDQKPRIISNNRNMDVEESRARCLMAFDRVVKPFIDEMHLLLQLTLHAIYKDVEQQRTPSEISRELDKLNKLEYFICHASVAALETLATLHDWLESVKKTVITHCHTLIEKRLLELHNVDSNLARKVSLESGTLKNMEEEICQVPMDCAVTAITDEYASLQRGVSHDLDQYTVSSLKKQSTLSSKIRLAKSNIESNSLERSRIRTEIKWLEELHEDLVTRPIFRKLPGELCKIRDMHLNISDIFQNTKRLQNLSRNLIGALLARGPCDIKDFYESNCNKNMNLISWILSEGKDLKEKAIKHLYMRITINSDNKPIPTEKVMKYIKPILLISGPPGSGKSVLAQRILEDYIGSTDNYFPEVKQYDLVVFLTSSSVKNGSFSHYLKNGIFLNCTNMEAPYSALQKLKVLYIVDFDCGFSQHVSLAMTELLTHLRDSRLLITCRPSVESFVRGLFKKMKIICNYGTVEPLTPVEVRYFCLECLDNVYPRSSGVEEMANTFANSLNYKTQATMLYPFQLIYLIKLWKDDASVVAKILTTTQLFNFIYRNSFVFVQEKEQCFKITDSKSARVSSSIFTYIEEEAIRRLFSLSGSTGFFLAFDSTPLSYHPIHPFVVSFNHIANGVQCQKLFFVHHIVIEYLAAVNIQREIVKSRGVTWSLGRKKPLPRILQNPAAKSECGFLVQSYKFLCGLLFEDGIKYPQQNLVESLTLLFKVSHFNQKPNHADWSKLLIETKHSVIFAKCISNHIGSIRIWRPSTFSRTANITSATLIRCSAVSIKEIILLGIEPALNSLMQAIRSQSYIKVVCRGGTYQVDEVVTAFVQTSALSEIQGRLSEKGCLDLFRQENLKVLDVTITSFEAMIELINSFKSSTLRKNISRVTIDMNFKITTEQRFPPLNLGKAYFTLIINGSNLDTAAVAIRVLRQLDCKCEELILNDIRIPSIVSRDLKQAAHPTNVTIKTIYQKSKHATLYTRE